MAAMKLCLLIAICSHHGTRFFSEAQLNGRSRAVTIGGLFSRGLIQGQDPPEVRAFHLAIDLLRADYSVLTRVRLEGIVETADPENDVENLKRMMKLLTQGAVVVIGPITPRVLRLTYSLSNRFHVPQIAPTNGGEISASTFDAPYLLRMSSSDAPQMKAIVDFAKFQNWTKIAVLASRDADGLDQIPVLKDLASKNAVQITAIEYVYSFVIELGLNVIKKSGAFVVILKCRTDFALRVMDAAKSMGMINEWAWILTDMALDERTFFGGGSTPTHLQGIVGVRQNVGAGLYGNVFRSMWQQAGNTEPLTANAGRVFDSVLTIASALDSAARDGVTISSVPIHAGICSGKSSKPMEHGAVLSRYLRGVQTGGFMNYLSFTADGEPKQAVYDIVNIRTLGYKKVGQWTSYSGLRMDGPSNPIYWPSGTTEVPQVTRNYLKGRTITITTFIGSPFVMLKANASTAQGSQNVFEGAVIDLLNILSETLQFKYKIYLVPDRRTGAKNRRTGKWNGAIAELINGKADLAIGPITMTSSRWEVIEFTKPFLTSGLGIVIGVSNPPQSYFRFLNPFSWALWGAIMVAIFSMGVCGWAFSVFSPYGFYGRSVHGPAVRVTDLETKDTLTLLNSLWSSAAYYLGQGPDMNHPVSGSGRVAVAVWWFVIGILGATYTANLAAYLTTTRMQSPINTVNDLAMQTKIPYGAVEGSQTQAFFEHSHNLLFQTMWQFMKHRQGLVNSTKVGLQRVVEGNYAFIHDQPILRYRSRKTYCGKMKLVGGTIAKSHYGFALPKGSLYTTDLSVQILRLSSQGVIKHLVNKWMVENTKCAALDELKQAEGTSGDASRMGVQNMLGVFVFMLGGVVVGFVILIAEWLTAAIRDVKKTRRDFPRNCCAPFGRRLAAMFNQLCTQDTDKGLDKAIKQSLSVSASSTHVTVGSNKSRRTSLEL